MVDFPMRKPIISHDFFHDAWRKSQTPTLRYSRNFATTPRKHHLSSKILLGNDLRIRHSSLTFWYRAIRRKCSFPYLNLNDFGPPPHQCWSWQPFWPFIFTFPRPLRHQCWRTCAQNAANPSSKWTLMREGAPKSNKNLHFWCNLPLYLLRPCSLRFSRPQ